MKRPHKTEVSDTARRPEPVTVDKWYQPFSEPVALERVLIEAAPLIRKARQSAENRRRAVQKHLNEPKRQSAQLGKSIAVKIAARLMQQERGLQLKGKRTELYGRIRTRWPSVPKPSIRTIRRWLAEK
jgi:hypothetical protein